MFSNQTNFQLKDNSKKAIFTIFLMIAFLLYSNYSTAQHKEITVANFERVVISPHIQVVFKEANTESVTIESINVPMENLNVYVKNNTLNVYLEGAKITGDDNEEYISGNKLEYASYDGTVVSAIINYKKLSTVDLRGEERFVFEDNIVADKLRLKVFGTSQVYINSVDINKLMVSIYGESYLEIKDGLVKNQRFTAYGEGTINVFNVSSNETRLTAYGDGSFQLNVSDKLKVNSYGEATVSYSGTPELNKGIVIGETKITKVSF